MAGGDFEYSDDCLNFLQIFAIVFIAGTIINRRVLDVNFASLRTCGQYWSMRMRMLKG